MRMKFVSICLGIPVAGATTPIRALGMGAPECIGVLDDVGFCWQNDHVNCDNAVTML